MIHTTNTFVSRFTSKSPYEVFLNRHILKNLAAQGIIYEEDIPEDIPMPDDGDNIDGISVVHSTNSDSGSEFTISDGREYFFLEEDRIVATRHEIPGQDMLSSVDVNIETHAILKIDEIHENLQFEFEENYLISWDRNHLVDSDCLQMDVFVKDYAIGDTVRIKIYNVDCTNTDARQLPCKVYEVTINNDKSAAEFIVPLKTEEYLYRRGIS